METNKFNTLLGALLFGSLWGMSEATLGVFLHLIHFPYKGSVMLSVGIMLMMAAVRAYKPKDIIKFSMLIGLIASFLKGFDIFLVGPEMMVLRPMTAIIIEALAFGAVWRIMQIFRYSDPVKVSFTGIGYSYLSYTGIGFVFTYIGIGSKFWLNKSLLDLLGIIAYEGTIAAIICSVTALIGYRIGQVIRVIQNSRLYYPVLATVILLSWTLGIGYG